LRTRYRLPAAGYKLTAWATSYQLLVNAGSIEHRGAVSPAAPAEAKRTGIPGPAPHSPQWLPDLEPTLEGAVFAETAALIDLLSGR